RQEGAGTVCFAGWGGARGVLRGGGWPPGRLLRPWVPGRAPSRGPATAGVVHHVLVRRNALPARAPHPRSGHARTHRDRARARRARDLPSRALHATRAARDCPDRALRLGGSVRRGRPGSRPALLTGVKVTAPVTAVIP